MMVNGASFPGNLIPFDLPGKEKIGGGMAGWEALTYYGHKYT